MVKTKVIQIRVTDNEYRLMKEYQKKVKAPNLSYAIREGIFGLLNKDR